MAEIKKYQKNPVIIEALQWTGSNEIQIMDFVRKKLQFSVPPFAAEYDKNLEDKHYKIIIPTLEGDHVAQRNDFIIKGVKGEFYPCKPDIFNITYSQIQ